MCFGQYRRFSGFGLEPIEYSNLVEASVFFTIGNVGLSKALSGLRNFMIGIGL